jgi:TIR domain
MDSASVIFIESYYRPAVAARYPEKTPHWPLLGSPVVSSSEGCHNEWTIIIYRDRPGNTMGSISSLGEMSTQRLGAALESSSLEQVRSNLTKSHSLSARDGVVLLSPGGANAQSEVEHLLRRHELALGLTKQRIFLSHKGADKPRVREFKATLEALGFQPWLDEDDMPAGVELNRGILEGMKDSCAAVFFVTKRFRDETWVGDEVDYAKLKKHEDGKGFSIITLVFDDATEPGAEANVPEILKAKYVYKKPKGDLEALREILRALPLMVGDVRLRSLSAGALHKW